jgi:uncharacterized protein
MKGDRGMTMKNWLNRAVRSNTVRWSVMSIFCVMLGVDAPAADYITAPPAGEIKPPTEEWVEIIRALAPSSPTVVPAKSRKILVFSLATGYKHAVTPHVKEVITVLGAKSGAFESVFSDDVTVFEKEQLKQFDAVVLNNVCPDRPKRDLFYDVLKDETRAAELESNLLEYVREGGGLVLIHGAITFQLNSQAVSEMMGGSFDWHPKFQEVTLDLVDPDHPLVAAFGGKGFIHADEPYFFKNAYVKRDFHPLLEMDVAKLDEETRKREGILETAWYAAWIRREGKGRVFFCGPSHHPSSYETEAMLRFLLDGIQYALGDLKCDDTPLAGRVGDCRD